MFDALGTPSRLKRLVVPSKRRGRPPEKEVGERIAFQGDRQLLLADLGRNLRRASPLGVPGVHVTERQEQLDAPERMGVGGENMGSHPRSVVGAAMRRDRRDDDDLNASAQSNARTSKRSARRPSPSGPAPLRA